MEKTNQDKYNFENFLSLANSGDKDAQYELADCYKICGENPHACVWDESCFSFTSQQHRIML